MDMTLVYNEDHRAAPWVATKRFVVQVIPAVGDLVEVDGHKFRVRERRWAADFDAISLQVTSTGKTRDIGQAARREVFTKAAWRVLNLPQ